MDMDELIGVPPYCVVAKFVVAAHGAGGGGGSVRCEWVRGCAAWTDGRSFAPEAEHEWEALYRGASAAGAGPG